MLKLTGITHRFGDHRVLHGVNLSLMPGQRIAIMGPSGCGKTTLLRILLGLQLPTEGTVSNTFEKPAVVFQEPRLLPWRTAAENVNLVLGDHPHTLELAKDQLYRLGLQGAENQYPHTLSGGMQQRVALARALALQGDLLVLDEPFKAMDDTLRYQVIGQVAKTNAALILVTHDEAEANALNCQLITL